MPGIPDLPDIVTVVPFYTKPNETEREKTKAVIEAEIDGRRGVFIFDLGDVPVMLNRTYLQPNAAGGVDTVTDANRIPDNTPRTDLFNPQNFMQFDRAPVTVRIGTLLSTFDDPELTQRRWTSRTRIGTTSCWATCGGILVGFSRRTLDRRQSSHSRRSSTTRTNGLS
jgi:hypothetical protein